MNNPSKLQKNISRKKESKKILLMSHSVMGYPSFSFNYELVDTLVKSGVDIIELQFPFSDPMADGPVLSNANQTAIENGTTVEQCFEAAEKITTKHQDTIFVIMTYYNVIYSYGKEAFIKKAKAVGIQGIIVPDLPPDENEARIYCMHADEHDVSPIFLCTPFTSGARLKYIAEQARGMIYCVSRKGITGRHTKFGEKFQAYIKNVQSHSPLPVGVGFGVRTGEDLDQLHKIGVDIGIICSHVIRMSMDEGLEAVLNYFMEINKNLYEEQ